MLICLNNDFGHNLPHFYLKWQPKWVGEFFLFDFVLKRWYGDKFWYPKYKMAYIVQIVLLSTSDWVLIIPKNISEALKSVGIP